MTIAPRKRRLGGLLACSLLAALGLGLPAQAQAPGGDTGLTTPPPTPDEDAPTPRRTGVGYIDSALPLSMFRFRFSSAYDDNRPDRGEFFYSQYQQQLISAAPGSPIYVNTPPSGQVAGSGGGGGGGGGPGPSRGRNDIVTISQPGQLIGNPAARGLPKPETKVDFHDLAGYIEWAVDNRFSVFAEVPVRFLNPEINNNTAGLADSNAGFKWAFLYTPNRVASFQLRTWIPTGASTHGLGTNHVSLEPSLLYNERLTDRLTLEGQLGAWVPIGGTDFEGDILQYGVGCSYLAWQTSWMRLSPVLELVGWTVLNGKETAALGGNVFEIKSAGGDSILNLKLGLRAGFENCDLYVGYGRALTGAVWYKNMLRAEFRLFF